jgi:hypothetical protein
MDLREAASIEPYISGQWTLRGTHVFPCSVGKERHSAVPGVACVALLNYNSCQPDCILVIMSYAITGRRKLVVTAATRLRFSPLL